MNSVGCIISGGLNPGLHSRRPVSGLVVMFHGSWGAIECFMIFDFLFFFPFYHLFLFILAFLIDPLSHCWSTPPPNPPLTSLSPNSPLTVAGSPLTGCSHLRDGPREAAYGAQGWVIPMAHVRLDRPDRPLRREIPW